MMILEAFAVIVCLFAVYVLFKESTTDRTITLERLQAMEDALSKKEQFPNEITLRIKKIKSIKKKPSEPELSVDPNTTFLGS